MLLFIYVRHIRRYAHDIPWVHMGVALFGNVAFVIGSLHTSGLEHRHQWQPENLRGNLPR